MAKPQKDEAHIWFGRRDIFSKIGWGSFFAFFGIMLGGSLRFMFPRVLFEPSTTFKAGLPNDYTIGTVSEKFQKEQRVWIIRNEDGFYALSAICTHLGCTPRWLQVEDKFKCPCHGSGFYRSGVNFEGPAPRPLERLKITKADDGQILIDKSIKFLWEKEQWDKPGAFLKA
ncbi:Rieske (2Fe-2S) protein [bacterium]|nr:Rieske (2Fe-2S) protein [bacterium]